MSVEIQGQLAALLADYIIARQSTPFPGDFRQRFDKLEGAFAQLPALQSRPTLLVRAGFGVGRWAKVPWLVILDPRETTTPQQGVAVALHFRQDMAGIMLSLNQGASRDLAERGRKEARAAWRSLANHARTLIGDLASVGFQLDGDISLGQDDGHDAGDLAARTIAWAAFPVDALPDDTTLNRLLDALLVGYERWVADQNRGHPVLGFETGALEEMRQRFLSHMTGFLTFTDGSGTYRRQERDYKTQLAAIFQTDLLPLLTAPPEDAAQADMTMQALHQLLTKRKVGEPPAVQNLLSWRATEHLGRLRGAEALEAACLFRDLLSGTGDTPTRVERFNAGYVAILARHMPSGTQGVSRSLPTLLLMLADTTHEIFVRTTLFNDVARQLGCPRPLSDEHLNAGDYQACLRLASGIRTCLQDWGWQPQDMIDVQSFLWVAASGAYTEAPLDAFDDATDPQSERRIFKIAPGEQARLWPECRKEGMICIGWDKVGDLREYPADGLEELKQALRAAYPEDYTGSGARRATGTRKAKEIWHFRNLQPGDIVLATRGASEILAMGEVVEPGYSFDPSRTEYQHTVAVRWNDKYRRDLRDRLPPGVRATWMNCTLSPVDRALYAAILGERPIPDSFVLPSDIDVEDTQIPENFYIEPPFADTVAAIAAKKLKLPERLLRRYHVALKTRGFVILAGVSGTGKTWLAEAYAQAVAAEYLVVPVAPNWTSREDLLGYVSPTSGEYQHTAFSRFLIRAAKAHEQAADNNSVRPFHVILDEMNLARAEHYFADFLSVLEQRNRDGKATLSLGDAQVSLFSNLVFIGTVNMDETTHGFAHKVYDRAQVIEVTLDRDMLAAHVAGQEYADILLSLWDALGPVAPFALRTADDIAAYVRRATALGATWQEAFDEAVLQKLLPRIRGFDPTLAELLQKLSTLTQHDFPLSHAKIEQMRKGLRDGVVSFF